MPAWPQRIRKGTWPTRTTPLRIKSSFAPRSSDSSSFGRPSLQYEETTFCHSRAHHQKASASRKKARFMGLWPGGAHAFESASKFMTHLVRQEMAPAYPLRPGKSPKMLAAASLTEGRASLRLRLEKFRSKSQNPAKTGYGIGHTLRLKPAGRRQNCAPGHKKVARHSLRARVPVREPDHGIGGRSCRHRSKIRRSSPLPEADCDPCRSLEEPRRGRRRFYAGNPEVRQFRASRGERSRSPFENGSRPGWNNQAAWTVRARIITMCRSI